MCVYENIVLIMMEIHAYICQKKKNIYIYNLHFFLHKNLIFLFDRILSVYPLVNRILPICCSNQSTWTCQLENFFKTFFLYFLGIQFDFQIHPFVCTIVFRYVSNGSVFSELIKHFRSINLWSIYRVVTRTLVLLVLVIMPCDVM